jgi:2-dehydropantoate 2-reductase
MAVAQAMGITVEPGGGRKLDYYRFLGGRSLAANFKRHLLIRLIGFKYRRIRSSSLQSLERGRQTEIAYLNGYICDRGRDQGVPTPLNDTLVSMVRQMEAGTRRISLSNLDDPVFDGV